MPSQRAVSVAAGDTATYVRDRARSRFFFGMSIVLMALVVTGFARTLFFRPFFDVSPIPGYLYLHGWILTGWYVLLIAQTSLIQAERTAMHRRLGILASFWGVLVVIGGQIATLKMLGRVGSLGIDLDTVVGGVSVVGFLSVSVWSSIGSSFEFAMLLTAAILLRGRSETHKRLLLLASILSVGAAIGRIANWSLLGGSPNPIGVGGPLALPAQLLLVGALVAHDLITTRRVHPATLAGGAVVLSHFFGVESLIATSEFGIAFTRWLQ